MITFNLELDSNKLSKFYDFAGDFVEIEVYEGNCYFYSQKDDVESFISVRLLDRVEQNLSIRISTKFIKNLHTESRLKVSYDSSLLLSYFDKTGKFMYEVSIVPQRGIADLKRLLELKAKSVDYYSVDLTGVNLLIHSASNLNKKLTCIDKLLFTEYEGGYLFAKLNSNNFCLPAKSLVKILKISSKFLLVDRYAFVCQDDLNVFFNLYRGQIYCDLANNMKQKILYEIEADLSQLAQFISRFKVNDYLEIDFSKKEVSCLNDEFKSKISIDVKKSQNFTKKEDEVNSSDDEMDRLLNESVAADVNDISNPNRLPKIKIKANLLEKCLNKNLVRFLINSNVIIMCFNQFNAIIPRVD